MLGNAKGERLSALRRAIEVLPDQQALAPLEACLARSGLQQKAALVALRSFRRQAAGPEVDEVLAATDPETRAIGLHAARYVAALGALPAVEHALGDADPTVRNAAVESGVFLGSRAATSRCRELARTQAPGSGPLLLVTALVGSAHDQELVVAALANKDLRRSALFALGFSGTRQAADACVQAMDEEDDAKLAAEAFSAITGLDLEAERLTEPEPASPDEPIPFEREDLDACLVPEAEELLPRPHVDGIKSWWGSNRARFDGGARYMGGVPASPRGLQNFLEHGGMRRRHAVAFELAVLTRGQTDVSTRAFTAVQRLQLAGSGPSGPGNRSGRS